MPHSVAAPAATLTGIKTNVVDGAAQPSTGIFRLEPGRAERSRLRIGIIAPPWFSVPPAGYGGIERVVSYLAEGLARAGHDVTLFASGGSRSRAKIVSAYDQPPSALLGDAAVEIVHTVNAFRMAHRFDVIHDHTLTGLACGVLSPAPVVHTMHGPITPEFARLYGAVSPPVNLIAISDHQRSCLPAGTSATVIHNAIDVERVPLGRGDGGYLLFVGRMSKEKGVLDAIEIARRLDERLLILAKVNEAPEREYFREHVGPALRGVDADVLFEPPEEMKWRAYGRARATLFPARWPEPFGLVMIESMAAGTPVVAFRNGSVPEVILDAETGFICDDLDEAVEATARAGQLSREACRDHVAVRFSAERAVARHEALYGRLAAKAAAISREGAGLDLPLS